MIIPKIKKMFSNRICALNLLTNIILAFLETEFMSKSGKTIDKYSFLVVE